MLQELMRTARGLPMILAILVVKAFTFDKEASRERIGYNSQRF
jgi:hypothetical protein